MQNHSKLKIAHKTEYFGIMINAKPQISLSDINLHDAMETYEDFLDFSYIPKWIDYNLLYCYKMVKDNCHVEKERSIPYMEIIDFAKVVDFKLLNYKQQPSVVVEYQNSSITIFSFKFAHECLHFF